MTQLISETDAAKFLGVSVSWLRILRRRRAAGEAVDGPPAIVLAPKIIRYDVSDLRSWLETRKVA